MGGGAWACFCDPQGSVKASFPIVPDATCAAATYGRITNPHLPPSSPPPSWQERRRREEIEARLDDLEREMSGLRLELKRSGCR